LLLVREREKKSQ